MESWTVLIYYNAPIFLQMNIRGEPKISFVWWTLSALQEQLGFPFDILLTTYDIALLDQDFLSQIPWHFSVIDEAQRLKNPSSVCLNFNYLVVDAIGKIFIYWIFEILL